MIEASKKICLDANLWVKLFVPEINSIVVRNLIDQWLNENQVFIAPSFLLFEFGSALRKKEKMSLLKEGDALSVLKLFYEYPILLYQSEEFLEVTWDLAKRMEEMVIYDVGYLALAAWQQVPFYTADEKFFSKAKSFYSECHLV